MSRVLGTNLIRLQCYEGLDASTALYEWNYQKRSLHIKLSESSTKAITDREHEIFSEDFLLRRPLLQAISQPEAPVLLIDEIDRADQEFEAFMLEIFSEWQVTIPEIGPSRPRIRLTAPDLQSARVSCPTRCDRRCLYLWIDYPPFDKELRIVERKVPGINKRLAAEIARFMESLRRVRLAKVPGVAESLDWAQALASLHAEHLDEEIVTETLGCILKDADDIKRFRAEVGKSGLAPFLQVPG